VSFGALRTAILLAVLALAGCGQALRLRSPDILPKGDVEVGAGAGAAGDIQSKGFGGAEITAWVRGSPSDHAEVGGRFWTHSFNTFGGVFELRFAPVRRPVALSIDLGLLAAGCCGAGARNNTQGLGVGFDAGLSFGGRIGGDFGPAPYFAPHFQMMWTLPPDNDWPKLLFFPVGVDIPLGKSPFHLRPEFIVTTLIYKTISPEVRIGGGFGFAIQGPSAEKTRAEARRKQAESTAPTPASSGP
jgi:hypothetical protein